MTGLYPPMSLKQLSTVSYISRSFDPLIFSLISLSHLQWVGWASREHLTAGNCFGTPCVPCPRLFLICSFGLQSKQ